jgi:tRNA pseudouridine55 synthase
MQFNFPEGEVLLLDKPVDWTSFDVVNLLRAFIRKVYHLKKLKVGHAGTLDPMASGLLILCTGKMTKQIDTYQGMDKVYVGRMQLGATTPSFDAETEIDHQFDVSGITMEMLQAASEKFLGEIEQVPPIYSAIKIKGQRAYMYARNNDELKLKSRKVTIHEFKILNFESPFVDFSVRCSKGTYIRALVRDFGESLNNGAFLTALRRTQIGDYKLTSAWTIETFKQEVLRQAASENANSE